MYGSVWVHVFTAKSGPLVKRPPSTRSLTLRLRLSAVQTHCSVAGQSSARMGRMAKMLARRDSSTASRQAVHVRNTAMTVLLALARAASSSSSLAHCALTCAPSLCSHRLGSEAGCAASAVVPLCTVSWLSAPAHARKAGQECAAHVQRC